MKTLAVTALSIFIAAATLAQSADDVAALTAALASAQTPDARIETTFALARAHELWAAADPENREARYRTALKTYSHLWLDEPKRADAEAAARNNCAQIYVALGKTERAAELFREAIAIDVPMRAFYLANYAEFLASQGDVEEAVADYEKALALQPGDTATEAKLLALYDSARVAERLWKLVGANELERAQRLALDRFGRDSDVTANRDLLSIVAVTLARQHATPVDFERVSARLDAFVEKTALAGGIKGLRRLYDGQSFDATAYLWWKERGPQRTMPSMEPPLAFSALACELGDQARATSPDQAERFYKLAIAVTADGDPDPYVALADLYFNTGRTDQLRAFFDEHRPKLMEMKGAALRSGDWHAVYRFHVALGTIYGKLGADREDSSWAVFHLEHARDAARELSAATTTPVLLDPRSVDILAKSYETVEPQSGKALAVRLEAAESYVRTGRTASAKRVLDPAVDDPRVNQGDEKQRFDKLRTLVPLESPKTQIGGDEVKPVKPDLSDFVLKPKRVDVSLKTSGLKLQRGAGVNLQKLLADYYNASAEMRPDLESKMKGFGVKTLNQPVDGKGSVELEDGRRTVTIEFEVRPQSQ